MTTGLKLAAGIAIESGGATALVADSANTGSRRLLRVTLATGAIQVITSNFGTAIGVVIEPGGATALVTGGDLYRVDLGSGVISVVSTAAQSQTSSFTGGLVLEAGGATVLATADPYLVRVNLSTGQGTKLGIGADGRGALALEPGGNTVLIGGQHFPRGRIVRSYLSSSISTITLGTTQTAVDVAIEAGGATALLAEQGNPFGLPKPTLLRVNLSTGSAITLATFPNSYINAVAIETGGNTALVTADGSKLLRVNLATGSITTITSQLDSQSGGQIRIESGGATALVGGGLSLYRVNLSTGVVTVIAGLANAHGGLAIEPGGTSALVTGNGGRYLNRIDLATGTVTAVATELGGDAGIGGCGGLAIEQGGQSILLTQSTGTRPEEQLSGVAGRIIRLNLATGAVTVIVPWGLSGSGQSCGVGGIAIESGGATALVADYRNGLRRIGVPAPSSIILTVTKAGTGSGTVASSSEGISCGATCSATYANGTSVTLTATPATGSTFTGWSGGDCTGTGTCTVTLTANTTVTGTFTNPPPVGAPSYLSFIVLPPTEWLERIVIKPAIQVAVKDANGNTVTTANTAITVALGACSPGGSILSGTTIVSATNGVATFSNLSINLNAGTHGNGCSLVFSATDLSGTGANISINELSATSLALEGNGTSALATIQNRFLVRIDLVSLAVTDIVSYLPGSSLHFVAIESGGSTALVTDDTRLLRVNLSM